MVKLKQRNFWATLLERIAFYWNDYCKTTSLHGFAYIAEKSQIKSIFWSIICMISSAMLVILIYLQFDRFQHFRLVTTISSTSYPNWKVPFPSVTICNLNLVYRDNIEHFTPLLQNVDQNDVANFFGNLSFLAIYDIDENEKIDWKSFSTIIQILEKAGYNTEKLMRTLAQPCDQMLKYCSWRSVEINCKEFFTMVKTTGGFCCRFNGDLSKKDLYTRGLGADFGLEAVFDVEPDQYVSSLFPEPGAIVAVNDKNHYIDIAQYSSYISAATSFIASIHASVIGSNEDIRAMSTKMRDCLFEDEGTLEWTDNYNLETCLNECKGKAILELCGCLPFYYPKTDSTRVCSFLDMDCITKLSEFDPGMHRLKLAGNFSELHLKALGDVESCNCFKQCNQVMYPYSFMNVPSLKSKSSLYGNRSKVIAHLSAAPIYKYNRDPYITWDSIVASIGGIIGLCFGGSIMSIIEFFYFLFTSLCGKFKNNDIRPGMSKIKVEKKLNTSPPNQVLYLSDFRNHKNIFF